MNSRTRMILSLAGAGLLIGFCVFGTPFILPSIAVEPTDTPTLTTSIQVDIPTLPSPGLELADMTPTEEIVIETALVMPPALAVPSPFNIMLDFKNGTCGGGDATYTYTVTINGLVMTMIQTDANITTLGAYDPDSGAFSTSADVGPGTETYTGVIAYDGQTILIGGTYGWAPDGGSSCGADISGETKP